MRPLFGGYLPGKHWSGGLRHLRRWSGLDLNRGIEHGCVHHLCGRIIRRRRLGHLLALRAGYLSVGRRSVVLPKLRRRDVISGDWSHFILDLCLLRCGLFLWKHGKRMLRLLSRPVPGNGRRYHLFRVRVRKVLRSGQLFVHRLHGGQLPGGVRRLKLHLVCRR